MLNLDRSLSTLAKCHNGRFVSKKQADFLLSFAENGEIKGVANRTYQYITKRIYILDNSGVTKIFQFSTTTGNKKLVWERAAKNVFIAKQAAAKLARKNNELLSQSIDTYHSIKKYYDSLTTDYVLPALKAGVDMSVIDARVIKVSRVLQLSEARMSRRIEA